MTGFDQIGGDLPQSPVIVSVSHAGRDYPAELVKALRVPVAALTLLEDRHVDAVARAARGGETMLVQRRARAWIDLNRAEEERDPRVDAGAVAGVSSAKLRSGLGLVPRRASGVGDLWRGRFSAAAIEARIASDHRPYHVRLTRLLLAARERWGVAVLLDLHSMPSLGPGEPRVVIGDRFGQSAGARFTTRLERACGVPHALNAPYAGGHIAERHGRPHLGIHALQLELDRSLYLDARLNAPGPGFAATVALVRRCIDVLAEEAGVWPLAEAAE